MDGEVWPHFAEASPPTHTHTPTKRGRTAHTRALTNLHPLSTTLVTCKRKKYSPLSHLTLIGTPIRNTPHHSCTDACMYHMHEKEMVYITCSSEQHRPKEAKQHWQSTINNFTAKAQIHGSV
eukprot:1161435-Pelagomonas_calceolata.AAC.5